MRQPFASIYGRAVVCLLLIPAGCSPKRSIEGDFTNPAFGTLHFQRRGNLQYEVDGLIIPGEVDEDGVYSLFILWAQRKGDRASMGSSPVMDQANRIALKLDGGKVVKRSYVNSAGEGRVRVAVSGDEARTGGGIVFVRRK